LALCCRSVSKAALAEAALERDRGASFKEMAREFAVMKAAATDV
jgi:hypothetical protein